MAATGKTKVTCPKCGREGTLTTQKKKSREGERAYYVVIHYDPDTKKTRLCYLGPVERAYKQVNDPAALVVMLKEIVDRLAATR
ncbi:MAG: hypothetical protein ACK4SY_09660 [Pyrobaculum sp.]